MCTADIHMGRRASRLRGRVDNEHRFAAVRAWIDVVDYAIDHGVDLLLLAGDVVDQDNRYFEAYGPLEEGLRRLASHGVRTLAVAGNHDIDVLPRLDRALDSDAFHLLGRGGEWERYTIERDGRPVLHVDGWSFAQQYVRDNPTHSYPALDRDETPVLVMLHGDLDNPSSPYGPISQADFERLGVDFWLLGHIHQPRQGELRSGSRFLYPGSPMALDPGEKGLHGPWLLEISGRSIRPVSQIALSRVRYEQFEIPLDGIEDETAFRTRVTNSFSAQLAERISDPGNLETICARLMLSGRTRLHHQRRKQLCDELVRDLELTVNGAAAFVEEIEDRARPDIDLQALARESSPPGILAGLLLEIERGELGDQGRLVLGRITSKLNEVHNARPFANLATEPAQDEQAATERLLRVGLDLLDALVSQQEGA
jgi:DNA repair protein SbcD/Mre11